MPSLKDRIRELRDIGAGVAPIPQMPIVDYSAPHTFEGVELEPDIPPMRSEDRAKTIFEEKLDEIVNNQKEIINNQKELIKRQKKIQAQVKKIAKAVGQ